MKANYGFIIQDDFLGSVLYKMGRSQRANLNFVFSCVSLENKPQNASRWLFQLFLLFRVWKSLLHRTPRYNSAPTQVVLSLWLKIFTFSQTEKKILDFNWAHTLNWQLLWMIKTRIGSFYETSLQCWTLKT